MRGPNCTGKDRFIDTYFKPQCVLSTDKFRLNLFDSVSKANSSDMVYELLKTTLEMRLRFGTNYTVINATNLKFGECADYISLAKKFKREVKFISIDPPAVDVLVERYKQRSLQLGTCVEEIDFEKQSQRYYTLMPRFLEVAETDVDISFVRIGQDWEIIQ